MSPRSSSSPGVPARLVPDNLETGVTRPDPYDPRVNRAYAEMAAHYGCLVDPARASKPKDEPRVERPMPCVRDSFWRGRTFDDVAHMQAAALAWCATVAGQRRHRGLDGARPAAVFAAVEADALTALPAELGSAVVEPVAELLEVDALHRLRSAQGILGLADRHTAARLDAACRRATEVGDPTYRTVKGVPAAGTEAVVADRPGAPSTPAHLHGPARLFAVDGGVAS